MADVELQEPAAAASEGESESPIDVKLFTAEADEVEDYAASALDNIFGSVNDALGAQISSAFDGGGDDDDGGADVDVLTLLFVLIISKIGISFSVGIDWSAFADAFGWLNRLSVLAPTVPSVGEKTVKTVTFVLLLLIQPACLGRMKWLSREHRGDSAPPLPTYLSWLPRVVRTKLQPFNSMFTPVTVIMWIAFWIIFIAAMATKTHLLAGFICLFLGFPAAYLTFVNYSRQKTWEYVYLRCADVVRLRQYENLCLKEGAFVLFLFVAAYSFVINFFISLMVTWDTQTGVQNAFVVIGFILYSVLPLWYLHHIITDANADRTFRHFREQLVSPFVDQHMYMKLVLLVEAALFSLLVLLGDGALNQLIGGFVINMFFFAVAVLHRPYEEDMENYSDLIARLTVCLTLMLGLVVQSTGSGAGIDVGLIIISCITTLWFLYTIDIKDIVLARFFLLLQLYAQAKAARYTKTAILKMDAKRVRRIADSPIEFFVLSAVQRIHFATLRKDAFFGGKRIKELADLEVTWLDFQQMEHTCVSLRALGFSVDELMAVDAQLDDMGDRSDIQKFYEDVYNERKASLGENDRSTVEAMHLLGVLFKDMGEHVMGLDHVQRAYKLRSTLFGATDADTLVSQQVLGEYYVLLGRGADGLELLQSCYEARKKDGEESEETLDCMRALGKCMLAVGLAAESLKILEERYVIVVKQTMEEKLRRDHPRTLPARLDYGTALAECGCYTSVPALRLAAIMNRQKTIHGADDPDTLRLMDQYAELLTKMGSTEQAKALLLECVSEKAATLGPNHTGTIKSKFALAGAYVELGRNMEMEKLQLEACLTDQENRLGETHPSTISSMVKLAAIYNLTNRNKEALALFKTVHDVRSKSLGKDHELTLGVANNIAAVYISMERFQEGKDLYEETLALMEARLGKAHLLTTAVLLNLGQVFQATGNLEKSLTMYKDTLKLCTETYGDKHPRSLLALESIGCVYILEQRWQEAHDIFANSMALKVGIYEETHPLSLNTLENIASCKKWLGQKQEALALFQRLCQLKEEGVGYKHLGAIKARVNLAIVMAELGNVGEAVRITLAAVQDATAALGPAAAPVLEYIGVLGYLYAVAGQWNEGIRYTNMSMVGTIKMYGEYHHLVKRLLERKAWMLQSAGRIAEASQVTAIINAIPADGAVSGGGGSANVNSPAASAKSAGTPSAAASTKSAGAASASAASPISAAGAGDEVQSETLSPLQQQLADEEAVALHTENEIAARINQIMMLIAHGQLQNCVPVLTTVVQTDIDKIRKVETLLLVINLSAAVLNAQQPALALQIMSKLHPIVVANFSKYDEILLPSMSMLGMAMAYSGNTAGATPILEEYCVRAQKAAAPGAAANPTLQAAEQLLMQLFGAAKQFDKIIAYYTAQFEHFRDTQGEASEAAITAINNRAQYHFALGNYDASRADHKEVVRLLIVLQGADHPETIQSVEGFKQLYASKGQIYE